MLGFLGNTPHPNTNRLTEGNRGLSSFSVNRCGEIRILPGDIFPGQECEKLHPPTFQMHRHQKAQELWPYALFIHHPRQPFGYWTRWASGLIQQSSCPYSNGIFSSISPAFTLPTVISPLSFIRFYIDLSHVMMSLPLRRIQFMWEKRQRVLNGRIKRQLPFLWPCALKSSPTRTLLLPNQETHHLCPSLCQIKSQEEGQ